MGSCALYDLTKEEKYKKQAIDSMNNYLKRIKKPKGIWTKATKFAKKRLSLGVQMIFVNLGIVLKDALKINDYDEEVEKCVNLVVEKFWNPKFNVLFENINEDYSFDLETSDGRIINPGHGIKFFIYLKKLI